MKEEVSDVDLISLTGLPQRKALTDGLSHPHRVPSTMAGLAGHDWRQGWQLTVFSGEQCRTWPWVSTSQLVRSG